MNLTHIIPEQVTSLSIIGLSKNAGKTTVLNALIETYKERGMLGIVSAGVDGEEHDVWSHRPKPPVVIPEGAVVATSGRYLDRHPGDWQLLHSIGMEMTGGPLFIAKARRRTTVKLIGVSSTTGLQQVLHLFKEVGIERTFVDGAYDRKAFASPLVTEGTLVVVGASMDASLKRIISKMEEMVHYFTLPVTSFQKAGQMAMNEKSVTIVQDEEMEKLPVSSFFQMKEFQKHVNKRRIQCIALSGAITDVMIRGLMEQKRYVPIVVSDATRVFASLPLLQQYYRKGGAVEVMNPIQLVGVAVNPASPEGYSFQPTLMKEEMRRVCPNVPVFDVFREGVGSGS